MNARPSLPLQSVYLRPSTTLVRVTMRSEAEHVICHWDPDKGSSVPCRGERCDYCQVGCKKLDKYLIGVSTPRGGLQLLEVRRAQYAELVEIFDKHGTLIGAKVDVYKRGEAANSRVVLEYRGNEVCDALDISKAVSQIGLRVQAGS